MLGTFKTGNIMRALPIIQSKVLANFLLGLPPVLVLLEGLLALRAVVACLLDLRGLREELIDDILRFLRRIEDRIREVAVAEAGPIPSNLDLGDPVGLAPVVGIPEGVGAAAVLLLVEFLLGGDLILAQGHLVGLPVPGPVVQALVPGRRPRAGVVDLLGVLPSGGRVGGGDGVESMLMRVKRRPLHAHIETVRATASALGIELHALHAFVPAIGIVIAIDEADAEIFAETLVLVLADIVLAFGMDVGIVEEDDDLAILEGHHLLHHGAAAGRAARVQQDAGDAGRGLGGFAWA
mmetsp:Transcript_22436/g.62604  ORF Transcript_22436/g.62604 Transcript_22436/m.62604 type:complete len:294 (+) Transcript_22436:1279-2160(+)